MRERLIELLEECGDACLKSHIPLTSERMADHLLAEGVIVPPVKKGQTVYIIGWCNDIEEFIVTDIFAKHNRDDRTFFLFFAEIGAGSDIQFRSEEIGKTVFLTKEEAEKALAERSK